MKKVDESVASLCGVTTSTSQAKPGQAHQVVFGIQLSYYPHHLHLRHLAEDVPHGPKAPHVSYRHSINT